jgi:hypothetical protein
MSTDPTWSHDASMRYLNAVPLPADFTWPHRDGGERPVRPVHHSVIGYGKWLRETPYFPGLFELAHDLLAGAPQELDVAWLPAELNRIRELHKAEAATAAGDHLAHKLRRLLPSPNQPTLF